MQWKSREKVPRCTGETYFGTGACRLSSGARDNGPVTIPWIHGTSQTLRQTWLSLAELGNSSSIFRLYHNNCHGDGDTPALTRVKLIFHTELGDHATGT